MFRRALTLAVFALGFALAAAVAQDVPLTADQDRKLVNFRQRLADLTGQKVIVFSYFRDTARYLIEHIREDPELASFRAAYLSSDVVRG